MNLWGRGRECGLLADIVAAVRAGESRTLVLRGEAGVGKTALLEHLIADASDLRVVRAVGVESEMELAYASLHQLCAPMLDRADRLPLPQRGALEVVFGLTGGTPPDMFLVGLAMLSLLSEATDGRPLLCIVDDAQWLDRASARTLAFVARRLLAEPVGLVFATRDRGGELDGLPRLDLSGLGNGDARAILATAVRSPLDESIRDRIVAETRGNPLALIEMPRGLTATQLAGGFGLLAAGPLPGPIERAFERRLDSLSEHVRRLLLIAAAEPVGDPLLLWHAAERLGMGPTPLASADTDGLLTIGGRVTFRHPLVRTVVYRAAAAEERRAVHLALAEVTDPDADPDRRAWHRAAAAAGPDEGVAEELEQSAGRAQSRGGLAAAAAFLERAVTLSADAARRTDRALAAAEASLNAGALDSAHELLSLADTGALDDLQRARLGRLRAEAAYAESRGSDAPPLLLQAAKTLESLDVDLARETYLDAWSAALFAGRLADGAGLREVSRAARLAPRPTGPPRPSDLLLDGFALLFTDGRGPATPVLRQAAAAFAGEGVAVEEVLRWGWLATAAAVAIWEYDTCLAVAGRGVELARESGALTVLPVALNVYAQAVALSGASDRAALLISEAEGVTEATGTPVAPYGALVLAALKGRELEASELIEATIERATASGQGTAVQYAVWARSVVLNGLGRYEEAVGPARDASEDTPELFVSTWALTELIEAAARSDDKEGALSAMERLSERSHTSGGDWALGVAARGRALVSEGPEAERCYREAIERLGRTRLRPELARARLLFGEWLRRENRRVEARTELRAAHELLTAIGMEAFAERARNELAATGEKVRKRTPETRDDLTAQESRIAELARHGLSNPEIGARLFLSPRTVEWHLHKVFTKLGIQSRRELTALVAASDSDLIPT